MKASAVSMEHLVNDLKAVAHDSGELLQASKSDVSDAAVAVRERLASSVAAARQTCRELQEKTVQTAKKADHRIREHPYQAAGLAFGFGLLIGVLVARR